MHTPLVTSDWLREHLSDPDLIILDATQIGKTANFDGIQITGARHFNYKSVFCDRESSLPNMLPSPEAFEAECRRLGISSHHKIVVYDKLGIYSSPRAWWMFTIMGHDQVAVLDGGMPDWVNKGFEVEAIEERIYPSGNFTATFSPSLVKNMTDISHNIASQEATVVDARSAGRFAGTAPEPRAGLQSGHIPKSKNLPFPDLLTDGKFKEKAQLASCFQALELGDQPLIFSCGSGITACILYLASEMVLDNQKAVYDGSWTEWGQSGHPVEREGF